jgi:hypothetical protein
LGIPRVSQPARPLVLIISSYAEGCAQTAVVANDMRMRQIDLSADRDMD